jgi:hypothetical protein
MILNQYQHDIDVLPQLGQHRMRNLDCRRWLRAEELVQQPLDFSDMLPLGFR